MLVNPVTGRQARLQPRVRAPLPYAHKLHAGRDHQRGREPPARRAPVTKAAAKRLDIQGLRALAVLLVALNHANISFLSGGYVGVDVFFVVSGYLITGLLLREGFGQDGGTPGRISIRGFYARRVRRILPAASLTLAVTSIAVFVVYDLGRANFLQTEVVLLDALAASLFYANIRFAITTTNYFAQASTTMPSPFQHFWSLSVEEQFYIVWAPVVAGMFYVCRRLAGRRPPERQRDEAVRRAATRVIAVMIAATCVLSLALSIHDTAASPQAAYFSTPGRVWELGCGATLALLATRPRVLPQALRELLGWVGLAMIVAAAVLYSSHTSFPGYAALLPVIGAGLIIVAGMAPTPAGVDRMLSARPLPYIGDRSYAFYLWHYPALILVWQATGRVLPVGVNLVLLTGAFMLSAFTYRFYENPLRFARWLRGWRTAAMVPVALTMSVTAVIVPIAVFQGSMATQASASAKIHPVALTPAPGQPDPASLWASEPIPAVAAAAKAAKRNAPLPNAVVPSLKELEQENTTGGGIVPDRCKPAFGSGVSSDICRLGDRSSGRVVVVLGDSQAGTWMPAVASVGRAQHFAVVPLVKPGCFVSRVKSDLPGWPCASWYRWALSHDKALHPVATIVMFLLSAPLQQHPASTVSDMRSVLSQVTNGVLIADHPSQSQEPDTCIYRSGANMGKCSTHVPSTYVPLMKALARMTALTHHPAIPTLQWFCADGICPMVIDNTLVTRDKDHMTKQYSTALAPLLSLELQPLLAGPAPVSAAPGSASARWSARVASAAG
ncbi:MAG TPA: acyltransferase family protein [Solirubrobacteraceae bacterium]|nr:acyltransferase family protein [Solirubrobacteraceae bacterium]